MGSVPGKQHPNRKTRADREIHTPPPQNRRSALRVQNWGWCVFFRGPQMGGWIRRGWVCRFWGTPIFRPEVPKPFKNRCLGPLEWKSGCPKNAKSNHNGSNPHLRPSEFNSHITPPKIPLGEEGLLWGWCGVRGPLKSTTTDFWAVHSPNVPWICECSPNVRLFPKHLSLRWHVCRVNFARKIFFEPWILRKMLRKFPRNFWAFVLWVRKNPWKIPSKFPTKFSKFPCEKSIKIHRRASAGTQGESFKAIF